MNVAVGTGLAFAAVMAICLFILWFGSAVIIDQLEDRIEVLERNWAEQFGAPVEDDSPEAMAAEVEEEDDYEDDANGENAWPDDAATDEFPAIPDTEPMALIADPTPAVQARRDAAWDERRPSPIPRTDSDEAKARKAAWVESELAKIRERIDAAQEAS